MDSFPYLVRWLEQHPFQHDPSSHLFLANDQSDRPLTPANINKKLRIACRKLGIEKAITAYSLKRNGVTFLRLRGDSDLEIQHRAGWTSTRQLKTYDLSTATDAFQLRLSKLGLTADKKEASIETRPRTCICGHLIGFTDQICSRCKRPRNSKQGNECQGPGYEDHIWVAQMGPSGSANRDRLSSVKRDHAGSAKRDHPSPPKRDHAGSAKQDHPRSVKRDQAMVPQM
ncbi:hypothetical protein DRQ53_13160 [bacterium]|nr:MAG: hypothetical protein DRQ53_13160 [bacterium]